MINYIQLATDVFNGDEDPLKGLAEIEKLFKDVKNCRDAIYAQAVEEAEKETETTFEKHGATFTKKKGATRYDFKHIKEWSDTKKALKDIEDKSKEAYKASLKGMEVFSTTDGSEVELPKVSQNKDSLVIKFIEE
jgi:hypothetical protein